MRIDLKIALYILFFGIGSWIVGMALPLRYPNIPPLILDIMIFGGLVLALGSLLLIIYELVIKPRIAKEVKLIPLVMVICGILLIFGGVISHFIDKTPPKIKESPTLGHRDTEDIKTLIDTKSKAELPELEKLFPGGFVPFSLLKNSSATGGFDIIKSSTAYSIDIEWGSASVIELNPASLTIKLENIKIKRKKATPKGIEPAGETNINGAAVWQIKRNTKLVYINNAISFWGYVLGAYILSDSNDEIILALGLQKIE